MQNSEDHRGMKITVLSGSPKGRQSVTLQYVAYLQKKFPDPEWKIHHVAQKIGVIEKRESTFGEIIDGVRESDGVLWAFPLYYMLCPAQYKRFIELIRERDAADAFRGKYAAVLTTSVHFYDHTAHNYMRAICDDLDMRFAGSFSPHMEDLLKEEGRRRLRQFAENLFHAMENDLYAARRFEPLVRPSLSYTPGPVKETVDAGDRKVMIVTDSMDPTSNLGRMIQRFQAALAGKAERIDLSEMNIRGGCIGCCRCALDNICIYEGKDDFNEFHRTRLQPADVIVIAGSIVDRYLSSVWKRFFDRSFFMGHVPSLPGKQIGFLVSGPLRWLPNLTEILDAWGEFQQSNVVDMVTDECEDSAEIDARIHRLAVRLIHNTEKGYIPPPTFRSVAAKKLFRDMIWGKLRFVFQADHRYYKKHGFYDFPHRNIGQRIFNAVVTPLFRLPPVRREMKKRLVSRMVGHYRRAVEEAGSG
jgi:multimeric flavodoxin WrbA